MLNQNRTGTPLSDLYRRYSSQMLQEFEAIADAFSNPSVKGTAREGVVAKFLQNKLPERFGVATGQLVATNGERSPQLDTIIYDRLNIAPFWIEGNLVSLPSEAVYATIEVKSYLNGPAVTDAVRNAKLIKQLPKTAYEVPPRPLSKVMEHGETKDYWDTLCYVFAYDSPFAPETCAETFLKSFDENQLSKREEPDALFVFKKGYMVTPFKEDDPEGSLHPKNQAHTDWLLSICDPKDILAWLVNGLLKHLNKVWVHPVDLTRYVGVSTVPKITYHRDPENT